MSEDLGPLIALLEKLAAEAQQPIWSVYAIWNESRAEVYFGVSKDPVDRLQQDHAKGQTKALRHWDFQNDRISFQVITNGLRQSDASSLAHGYEDMGNHGGYRAIKTRGI